MLLLNISSTIDNFLLNKRFKGDQKDIDTFIKESINQDIRELGEKLDFWNSLLTSDSFDPSLVKPEFIFEDLQLVGNYLTSKFPNNSDISDIASRLTTGFYNSISGFNDKNLAELMMVFLNHFSKIAYLIENSSEENHKIIEDKVKTSLMIFPGCSGNYEVEFACIEGSIVRIQEASQALEPLPIDQQIYQDCVLQLAIKLSNKKFPNSSVTIGNQIHLEAFVHSLFTLNHHLEQFYRLPDEDISLYDVLTITRDFRGQIKERVDKLNQEIAIDANLNELKDDSTNSQSKESISIDSLTKFLAKLKEKYDVELTIYDLMLDQFDEGNFSDDGLHILKTKLKSHLEVQQLIEQKLVEKFPSSILLDSRNIDQFDFLAELHLYRYNQDDLSLSGSNIQEILELFPLENNPINSIRIRAGLMITQILARTFKNQDPMFFMALCDQLKQKLKIRSLSEGFDYFAQSILSQDYANEEQANLSNLLAYLDSSYQNSLQNYFENDNDLYLMYKKIYIGNLNFTEIADHLASNFSSFFTNFKYCRIVQNIAVLMDHKEVYKQINLSLYKCRILVSDQLSDSMPLSDDRYTYEHLFFLRKSLGNRIAKKLFLSSTSSDDKKSALIKLLMLPNENGDMIFNISTTKTNNQFFIDLLDFLGTINDNQETIKHLLTTRNIQQKNAIETAVDCENLKLFMIMLDCLDEQQITDILADDGNFEAITNGINQCYLEEEFDFVDRLIKKILTNNQNDKNKIALLLQGFGNDSNTLLIDAFVRKKDEMVEEILMNLNNENKMSLLTKANANGFTLLDFVYFSGCHHFLDKIFFTLDDDQKLQLLLKNVSDRVTPFYFTCQDGDVKAVEEILSKITDVDKKLQLFKQKNQNGFSALDVACQNGHDKVVEKILINFNNPQKTELLLQKNQDGHTPLHIAIKYARSKVIMAIFNNLELNQKMELLTENGYTNLLTEDTFLDDKEFFDDKLFSILALTTCMADMIKEIYSSSEEIQVTENFFEIFNDSIKILTTNYPESLANLFCNSTEDGFEFLHYASSKSDLRLIDLMVDTLKQITGDDKDVLDSLINKQTHGNDDLLASNPNLDSKTPLYFVVDNLFSDDDSKTDQQTQKELKIIEKLLANILKIDQKTSELIASKTNHKNYRFLNDLIENSACHSKASKTPDSSIIFVKHNQKKSQLERSSAF